MATHAMTIVWGLPTAGQEFKALEEFSSNVAWWTELREKGMIEDFGVFGLLTGNMNDRSGFVIVKGDKQQIEELAESEEFRTRIDRVMLMVPNIRIHRCETGERMMERMQRYGKIAKAVRG